LVGRYECPLSALHLVSSWYVLSIQRPGQAASAVSEGVDFDQSELALDAVKVLFDANAIALQISGSSSARAK
jgi:hypothetical protein